MHKDAFVRPRNTRLRPWPAAAVGSGLHDTRFKPKTCPGPGRSTGSLLRGQWGLDHRVQALLSEPLSWLRESGAVGLPPRAVGQTPCGRGALSR